MIFVSDRIEEIVRTKPNLPAVVTEDDETFTYKQFNQQAEIIAEMLIDVLQLDSITTFQETQMVGLLMERTMAVVTMFLAIHKAGCAYVPVDPAFPPDRQSYILEHSKCNVLIVDEECFEGAKKQNMEIPAKNVFVSDKQGRIITRYVDGREVSLQEGRRELSAGTMKRVRELNRNAESIAYVLYTSGSTGKPKGVAVKQVGVDNIIKFFADELKVGPSDSVMGLTTFCFDISVLETFVPLTRGGVFVLAKSATRKDPFHILELMETHKVTIFQATPTTYEMMMATGWNGDAKVKFLIGGEAFRPTLLPLAKNCADLLNVYGPTETTIWSTFYRVGAEFEDYARSLGIKGVPIGKAISDTTLYLVGENQPWKEVVFGEEGELFIGGIGVAAGYLHAPHLTKDRFIPNPFGEGLVYRTGDSVKQLPDGNYIFMRRLDDQVKIDGFRIELEEIEKVYMQHEAVDKAVALVREKKIVIYIKPQESIVVKRMMTSNGEEYELEKEMLDSINADASKHLTYYMMPKFNVILLDFPKTPNGKLDKKALPTPRVLLEQVAHEEEKAANLAKQHTEGVKAIAVVEHYDGERPVSAFICDSVAQLRGVRPQVTSSLSTFGLDSLGSVMLLRQLSTSLKGEIPIKMQDLFAINTTIKSLGQTLYNRASEATRKKLKLIPEKEGDEATFLEEGEVLGEENNIIHQPDYFGTVLLSNRRLMDGLRGLFTLMVLYDHWHSDRVYVTTALNVDTTLFYMISGFTTAAQLRVLPIIKKEPSNSIKTGGKVLTTSPKPAMDLGNFFLIRAVGLYPIMWLSLIINIPIWRDQDKYQFPHHEAGMPQEKGAAACSFLYVIGMNVWSQTCTSRGPDVRYASGLIITMMFYGFFRYYWTKILRYFSRSINLTSLTTVSNGYHDSNINLRDPNQSWTDYFGKVSVYLGYNLYHPEVLLYYSIVYVILMFGFFWQNAFANAKLVTSVEYFAITAFLLVICEMICGQRIIQLQQEKKQDEQSPVRGSKEATKAQQQYEAPPVIEEDLSSPWDVLQGYYDPIVRPMRQTMNQGYQAVFGGELFDNNDNDVREEDKKTKEEEWSLIGLLWRFSPDIIIVLCLISFSCLGDLCHNTTLINAIENVVVPTAFLLYLVIVLSQRGKSRYNLSRLILETEIMNQIGYASYPIYLIQNAFLQYYFTYMVHHHNYSYHGRNPGRGFFRNLPFKYRFGCTFFVIFIGWVIQKYYQDWFITGIFAKVLSWWRQRNTNNNSANNHHRGNKYRVIHVSKKDQDHDDDNHGSVIIDDIIHHHEININKEENKADEVRNVKSSKRISNEDRPIYASL